MSTHFYFSQIHSIPELFVLRIGDSDDEDGSRYVSFPTLVEKCVKEIRED